MTTNQIAAADQNPGLIIPGAGQFTEDEVQGGMDTGSEGYVSQYPYMISMDGAKFSVKKTDDENAEPILLDKLEAIVFYGHGVYRLHQGTLKGNTSDFNQWSDDDRALVAQTYASPWSRVHPSRGNFDSAGVGKYLDEKELRKELMKRQYIVMALPGVLPAGALAIATFGSTAMKAFNDYANMVRGYKVPMPYVLTEISLKQTKSERGFTYQQVVFSLMKNDDGQARTSVKGESAYRQHLLPVLEKVKETHEHAIKMAENQSFDSAPAVSATWSEPDESIPGAPAADESRDPLAGMQNATPTGAKAKTEEQTQGAVFMDDEDLPF